MTSQKCQYVITRSYDCLLCIYYDKRAFSFYFATLEDVHPVQKQLLDVAGQTFRGRPCTQNVAGKTLDQIQNQHPFHDQSGTQQAQRLIQSHAWPKLQYLCTILSRLNAFFTLTFLLLSPSPSYAVARFRHPPPPHQKKRGKNSCFRCDAARL